MFVQNYVWQRHELNLMHLPIYIHLIYEASLTATDRHVTKKLGLLVS